MEPAPRTLKINLTVVARCIKLEQRISKRWISGMGPSAVFENVDLGWWMLLEGSYESIYVGETKPRFEVGDKIKVTFEKLDG